MSLTFDRIARLSPEKLALLKRAVDDASTIPEPIAVVGMGCRFPGCRGIEDYWRVIREAVDVTDEIPDSRWDIDDFFDAAGGPGKMTTRRGGFLENVDRFDATFFGISPREAERMDPQQRLLLEVVWEALEYGAIAPSQLSGSSTGVFVGVGGVDYSRIPVQLNNYFEQITAHSGTGNALSIVANRVSYILDLRGPSVSIDTACSSSLVATHLAIRSLRAGECDVAIAGGVNLILTPETTLAFSQAHMLSPEGKCRPFDWRANGYVRGEGCGAVILKRLNDAVSSGDIILATIRGSAVNQDGRTSGIAAPRGPAQVSVIRRALDDAKLAPDDITYVETHGTGTPLGDPIEIQALAEVFRNKPNSSQAEPACYLGSVKANVGHTETCAGMASLIKTILMLRERCIPRQKHFERLNPNINLAKTRLQIAGEVIPWQTPLGRRIAGISSFGFGGTNAHLVLEEAPEFQAPEFQVPERQVPERQVPERQVPERQGEESVEERPKHLLVLSAKSPEGLRDLASLHAEALEQANPRQLADWCFTAATGRSHFDHRLAIPTSDRAALQRTLRAFAEGQSPREVRHDRKRSSSRLRVAFLFAGQGSQYQGMGRQLYDSHPVFRAAIDQCDEILQPHLPKRLVTALFDDRSDEPLLNQTQYTQPALFALEYALSRMWRSIGVEPAVMIGHSVGEYVASCEAGVFSLEDGLQLLAHRARLMQSLPHDGAMAVIFAEFDQVADAIAPWADQVAIAAHNGPENVVISGSRSAVGDLVDRFEAQGVRTQKLNVSHPFHSPLMDPILDEFERLAEGIRYSSPRIPLISNRTGGVVRDEVRSAGYWRDHLRGTVRFAEGVAAIEQLGIDVALEIGPATTLVGMARRAWTGDAIAWLPSLRSAGNDWEVLLDAVAELYTRGADIDWREFDRPWSRKRLVLPTYRFQGQSYWYDMSRRIDPHTSRAPIVGPSHPLLGHRLEMAGENTVFEVSLQQDQPGYLVDHRVDQSPVVPAAALIEQALAAGIQVFGSDACSVSALTIEQALVLDDGNRRTVQLHAGPVTKGECPFEIYSQAAGGDRTGEAAWVRHATGTLRAADRPTGSAEPIDGEELRRRMTNPMRGAEFYQQMSQCGLRYGPSFQVVEEIRTAEGEALARLVVPPSIREQSHQYQIHPAILDGCWQSVAGVVSESGEAGPRDLFLPTGVQRVHVYQSLDTEHAWVHVRRRRADAAQEWIEADISLLNENGTLIAELTGARAQRVVSSRRAGTNVGSNWLYEIRWQPTAPRGDAPTNVSADEATPWIVFADQSGLADHLTGSLRQLGHQVWTVTRGEAFRVIEDGAGGSASFELEPLQATDYRRLLEELERDARSRPLQVVDLWTADTPELCEESDSAAHVAQEICGHGLQLLQTLARSKTGSAISVSLVTRGAQRVTGEEAVAADQSAVWGLARSARVEMPYLSCRLIDLDPDQSLEASAPDLLQELVGRASDDQITEDQITEDQIAYRQGERFAARLRPAPESLDPAGDSGPTIPPSSRYSLRLTKPGSFDSLRYVPVGRRTLGPGEVEVSVGSAGLNFSDVMKALGLYPGIKDEIVPLGIELAGVVTAIGQDVAQFNVGQRVMGVAPYSFGSHVVTPEYALTATPDGISDDEAATIPIAFLTAYHALCRLARLRAGERVLIHAGAGGVGLAAIQIAQSVGAEIFATAGSDQKRDFLRALGLSQVMNSRTLDFADQIMEITAGQGVDVVLNSLPGEAITKSLSILSAYGRFLEIGKTDIYQNRQIGLRPFQDNLSYFAIDLDRMLRQRPDEIRELYQELVPYFQRGEFSPLPLLTFTAEHVVDAFRYMAQRKNIGKVVVSFPHQPAGTDRSGSEQANCGAGVHIRDDATYLVTGGLGALGLKLADWLGSHGARHVVLMSRGRPGEHAASVLDSLRNSGVAVAVIRGDVCDGSSLEAALAEIPEAFPALRGVIHAAGVLDDGILVDMDLQRLARAMSPKVQGAWNLHRTIKAPLDFFVLFSSVAATMGSPGQANYAAGNAFMDGLAAYRTSRGLPATSIAWGPWDDAGMAADDEVRRQLQSRGMRPLRPPAALGILDQILVSQPIHLAVVDASWETVLARLPRPASRMLDELQQRDDKADATGGDHRVDEALRQRLRSADAKQRRRLLAEFITGEVSRVMGGDSAGRDADQPLASLGLDSLMGMELKANIESKLGIEVPAAKLFDGPSVNSLVEVVSGLLGVDAPAAISEAPSSESPHAEPSDAEPSDAEPSDAESNTVSGNGRIRAGHGGDRHASRIMAFGGARKSKRTPLFCLHPVGGDLRCYRQLARHTPDRPLYGLRASGLDAHSTAPASLDEMTRDYISAIRATQPEGPYCLMGWSTGGIFAYEIARRLELDQVPVGTLIMLDSPQPSVFRDVDLSDNARFLTDMVNFANYFSGTSMQVDYPSLHEKSEEDALRLILQLSQQERVLPAEATVDYLRRLVNVCKQHVHLFQTYRPKPCGIPVHLVRPQDTSVLTEATGQNLDEDFGWGSLVELYCHQVPGHHFTMLTGDNAKTLAQTLSSLLHDHESTQLSR